jgi:hypothetical protein
MILMAIHQNVGSMATEAINEYLAVAEHCVTTEKPGGGGGVYGFPAVLLLFSVVDAFSEYLGCPRHSFGALKKMDPQLTDPQVRSLGRWFRNPASHQAMIMPGTMLSLDEGSPFEFTGNEPSHIRVRPFCRLVSEFWKQFDRSKITAQFHPQELPRNPVPIGFPHAALTTAPIAPSGCYVPQQPKERKG